MVEKDQAVNPYDKRWEEEAENDQTSAGHTSYSIQENGSCNNPTNEENSFAQFEHSWPAFSGCHFLKQIELGPITTARRQTIFPHQLPQQHNTDMITNLIISESRT